MFCCFVLLVVSLIFVVVVVQGPLYWSKLRVATKVFIYTSPVFQKCAKLVCVFCFPCYIFASVRQKQNKNSVTFSVKKQEKELRPPGVRKS